MVIDNEDMNDWTYPLTEIEIHQGDSQFANKFTRYPLINIRQAVSIVFQDVLNVLIEELNAQTAFQVIQLP